MARGKESALSQTTVMILAGGQGERLYPLTKDRAKLLCFWRQLPHH
jgi:hypothetical protein